LGENITSRHCSYLHQPYIPSQTTHRGIPCNHSSTQAIYEHEAKLEYTNIKKIRKTLASLTFFSRPKLKEISDTDNGNTSALRTNSAVEEHGHMSKDESIRTTQDIIAQLVGKKEKKSEV